MKRSYYIFSSGKLSRKENTIFFYPSSSPETNSEREKGRISSKDISTQEKPHASPETDSETMELSSPGNGITLSEEDLKQVANACLSDSRPGIGDYSEKIVLDQENSPDIEDSAGRPEQEVELSDEEEEAESNTAKARPKKVIPVEDVDSIYIFGEISLNTKFLNFASQNQIPIHVFNYYGYYSGSYYPREFLNSGLLLVKQVQHYVQIEERLRLARKFVLGAAQNILRNLKYYNSPSRASKGKTFGESGEPGAFSSAPDEDFDSGFPLLAEQIDTIESLIPLIEKGKDVKELMAIEGNIRQVYYTAFEPILGYDYEFKKRVKRPPDNAVNALISFGNSMVYTSVLSEIYKTQLSPLISYLHEPGERRFSLALDISEIFKPILADRIIFKVLNKRIIQENDFEKKLNYAYLKESGRKSFVKEFEDRLQTTIQHRSLRRSVSYRTLIRLECYKLVKHLLGEKEYEPFQIWW
ncbi:MAG: type I-B CRISPR-associated endonuclease Cas1b [Bacteroidota bacterium]